jgi:hypothetical protein
MSSNFSVNSGSRLSLKVRHQMRLQPVRMPDASHAGFADASRCRHRTGAPVRGVGWLLLQRHRQHFFHPPIRDGARSARSRSILLQGSDAAFQKAVPPPRHFFRRQAHLLRDLLVLQPCGGSQHDPRPLHHAGRQRALPRQTLQRNSLFGP